MSDLKEIEKIISATLEADFKNVNIIEVMVDSDIDSDGDDILLVNVIFKGQPKDLDVSVVSGAVRHVRPKLSEMGEEAFPLFSFISQKEAKLAGLERESA